MQALPQINPENQNNSNANNILRELAHRLAKTQTVEDFPPPEVDLLEYLDIWDQALLTANGIFKTISSDEMPVSRAGEWMLDNYYVIKQTFRQIEEDLPATFLNQLPTLNATQLLGHPRIFALAGEWIRYSQSQLDLTQAITFIHDYQQVTPLTIGELWAFPSMLRIGVLEQLVYATAELTGMDMPIGLKPELESKTSGDISNQIASPAIANETIVANCFLSLRLLSTTDWKDFFEQTSQVEQILRGDPSQIYSNMDFNTRNSYRSVIEELAHHSKFSEEQVAIAALECAKRADEKTGGRKVHVGYYLRDAGRAMLESKIQYQPELKSRLKRVLLRFPAITYLGSTGLVVGLLLFGLLAYVTFLGGSPIKLIIAGILGFGLAVDTAISLVNRCVTRYVKPQGLPRMDFSKGIPAGNNTMVVIPTLIESTDEINHLLQELEIHYLSNPDPHLTFALLSDFGDAPARRMPGDDDLIALAKAGIEKLNQKYNGTAPFYIFHRGRKWNPSEGVWMGWERKRGKLTEFNHLILDSNAKPFSILVGDLRILPSIKYVITLDADTTLPQGSAKRLIATLAHPLNQAEFAADGRSVVAGYTVLQPRVAVKPTSAIRSSFSQISSENAGFDLYSFAVSDVYQDLFGEGSYIGKGIYDVAAFERSLAGQVRESTLLSHDLIEGVLGRAALVTDVVLYEEYPARYLQFAHRKQRWIRGDWQLLPWLFPNVQTQNGVSPNRISTINYWKIFDNLRRSLLPPTILVMLAAGWLYLPGSPLIWTLMVLLPSSFPIAAQTFQFKKHGHKLPNLFQFSKTFLPPFYRWALAVIFLPYEALLTMGAVGITLTRLIFTHKRMLQWTTAAKAARSPQLKKDRGTWVEMVPSLILTVLLGYSITAINPAALLVALPLLFIWLIAPQIANVFSRSITQALTPLSEVQTRLVRRIARRTWAYFEQFVGPNDHWLPPDHFQESPGGIVGHYTTPTNIGLLLVSTLSAYDLGYINLIELELRLQSTFENIDNLEHYRGHLLNWYNSQTMAALPPHYISTVDSGNLAACLITLKQGCLAMVDAKVLDDKQWQGLLVLIDIMSEVLQALEKNNPHASIESFEVELTRIYERCSVAKDQPFAWKMTLDWLSGVGWERVSERLMDLLTSHPHLHRDSLTELQLYLDLMYQHLQDMQRSLNLFAPWFNYLEPPIETVKQMSAWKVFQDKLPVEIPTMGRATEVYKDIKTALGHFKAQVLDENKLDEVNQPHSNINSWNNAVRAWCLKFEEDLIIARTTVNHLLMGYQKLAVKAHTSVTAMDFRFLFNERRQLFHIGYTPSAERLDPNYYDLLASESRIASFIAIAKGDVPLSHWQHLGRPITQVNGKQVLLSWSGTMFEYLMPTLFVKDYANTFLAESCKAALDAQISYGQQHQVPWGISESGYYAFDVGQHYQYRAFGVPDLGYKRDLPNDLVIAPYASLIGLSLQPQEVVKNIERLKRLKLLGRFGLYEAIDFTKSRLPEGQAHAIVQSYMAHHQGMILLATCNYLSDNVLIERFHADKYIQSVELLLQEKIPQNPPLEFPHTDQTAQLVQVARRVKSEPWRVPVNTPSPQVHVLSQGDTSTLITNSGGGFSQWRGIALTRWQADSTLDQWGQWIYVQDRDSGALWSATCQPIICKPDYVNTILPAQGQEVLFYPHKVEFQRSDNEIILRTEITVSMDGVEIRRVNILNNCDRQRRLKLTSYGEVVLAEQTVDQRHPAFNKLFIKSEYLPKENAILFTRRPRSKEEKPIYLVHAMCIETGRKVTGDYAGDRSNFLGRSRTTHAPLVFQDVDRHLSGTIGGTLDPIFSLAQEIDLKPRAITRVSFLTFAAASRAEALSKLFHYRSGQAIYHAFINARAHSERELLELGLNSTVIENIQRLLSALIYPISKLRAAPHILAQNEKGQSGLWAFGISGDHPILLVILQNGESPLLLEVLQAFIYWRSRHITVNLVFLNEQDTDYSLELYNKIQRQIERMGAEGSLNQRNGIFILRTDQLKPAERILLKTVAGAILDEKEGSLSEQTRGLTTQPTRLPEFTPSLSLRSDPEPTPPLQIPENLLFENGLGGFDPNGKEYVIHLQLGHHTPQPWTNVIANPDFGFLVSETGSACTWAENSGENRLTPWRNDPVIDLPGEALYLRDEETGMVWSPTLMPAGADTPHIIRHGAGYSVFESQSHGLNQYLRMFAAPNAPVKIISLRLKNLWKRPRRVTVTYYAEWVLGTTRDKNQAHIIPEFDPENRALLATNRYNSEFGERVAFLAANKEPHSVTTDRTEFLGRLGSMRSPAALHRIGLASTVNAGLDPCAVLQVHVDLAPGAIEEVFFLLGEGENREESLGLISQFQSQDQIDTAYQAAKNQWDDILNTIKVETPDPSMNLMLNRWLLYQTLSCRIWGRTGFYQSSGAFGFRDQLQDVMALLHARPEIARAQILDAARHQFEEGDVLHWWNPPSGRGVRTRISDDLLWLPFITAKYVATTGDIAILNEKLPFLTADVLNPGESERYSQYQTTTDSFSLYEHCCRALEKGTTAGIHGLPLIGAGDWNDGMNQVGIDGKGESIWLGWFLHATLKLFAPMAVHMGENPDTHLHQAKELSNRLAAHAWDGNWYLRAFYDDGSTLGSSVNDECKIDSIAQSWAVLSGAAEPIRATQAMESVNRLLVDEDEQMILLFTPPFDKTARNPGYIKGYLPGIRENGGQYTHAAIWTAWAFAELGLGDHANTLFRLLNPINHADTPEKAARYKVEPYVIAADIYSIAPHTGMGGWTWYTGSSGWLYRFGIEAILGLSRVGNALKISPCIPQDWPGFSMDYRFGATHYQIIVKNPDCVNRGIQQILLDGNPLLNGELIPLIDDGNPHKVSVVMGNIL